MASKNTIAVLIPFFGKVPAYFSLWADSCRRVPGVDFWILTDIPRWPLAPPNVKFHQISLAEVEALACERLGLPVRLKEPYKLCDFKPTLGHLFESLIAPYAYWGYGDIDQVFSATLSVALEQMREGDYDVFNTHAAFMHAPFVLMKNTPKLRQLFFSSRHWRAALTTPDHTSFDEAGGKMQPLRQLWIDQGWFDATWTFFDLSEEQLCGMEDFECFTTLIYREARNQGLKVLCQNRAREELGPGEKVFVGPEGIVDSDGRQFDFYHWVTEKPRRAFTYPDWREIPERYYVTRQGFYDPRTPKLNIVSAAFRWSRALVVVLRDRFTYALHRYLGITLDKRWRGRNHFF